MKCFALFYIYVLSFSHWGKFGQNPQKSKMTYISEPQTYIKMMTDNSIEVSDVIEINDETIALRWTTKDDFVEALPNTNIVLAAYTTAHARLKLYTLLEQLQDRVLYMDTDSVVYIHKQDEYNPPIGDYLGELKDETRGIPSGSLGEPKIMPTSLLMALRCAKSEVSR